MFPPFPSDDFYLQLYTGKKYFGANEVNLRETFYPIELSVATSAFKMPGSSINLSGAFYSDAGDLTMPDDKKEPRYFGEVYKLTQVVTGRYLSVRIQISTGWGSAQVYIDGKKPSTIAGVVNPVDVLTCDSDYYLWYSGPKTMDVVIAENLADGPHTVTLYCNNAAASFFAYHGMKGRFYQIKPQTLDLKRVVQTTKTQTGSLILHNSSALRIDNVRLTMPPSMYQEDGRAFKNSEWNVGSIESDQRYALYYSVDGRDKPDTTSNIMTLSAEYEDASGSVSKSVTTILGASSPGIKLSVGGWQVDKGTPLGEERATNVAAGAYLTFQCNAPTFTITVQKEFGFGVAQIYVNNVLLPDVVSSADPDGGGFLMDVIVNTGLVGFGTTAVIKVVPVALAEPFAFTKIRYVSDKRYSAVTEVIPIVMNFTHVAPYVVASPNLVNGAITYVKPNKAQSDWTVPATNLGVKEVKTYSRFPTFCVYYGSGNEDILSEYDLLVVEPSAVSYKQVKAWRDQGIKVYGYVSFGEEDGERVSPFDLGSDIQGPHRDDGLGVGGYASYYNKSGNGYGEASECNHDCQRALGEKRCDLSNPNYYTSVGRCSPACSWDTRKGGIGQAAGLACSQGYTRDTFWIRDAMKACRSASCPSYKPVNKGCTDFTPGDIIWGQDFSTADVNYPDQNGIWASTFINPIAPRWREKLRTYYLRTVFGMPEAQTDILTLQSFMTAAGQLTMVTQVTNAPLDDAEPFTVSMPDNSYTFLRNTEFSYDSKTGVISLNAQALPPDPALPVHYGVGTQIKVSYYRKGLNCDGVFMDTVDTVDVYPSPEFQSAFAGVVNGLKSEFPTRMFCSNRGFSILNDIIHSCSHVMFESFLCDYNWATDEYGWITNPDSIAYNAGIKAQLKELRRSNVFDVLALNYCKNGPEGDALREKVYEECYREGYMCWTSTILLNAPEHIRELHTNRGGRIQSTAWRSIKVDSA